MTKQSIYSYWTHGTVFQHAFEHHQKSFQIYSKIKTKTDEQLYYLFIIYLHGNVN